MFGQEGSGLAGRANTFFWAAGDSNDRIEGSSETDTLLMLGNGVPKEFELSANDSRLRLFRNVASVVLDIAGVERIELESRGGSDMITLSSLVGAGLQQITLDLEAADSTNTPDALPDSLFVFGRTLDDQITVADAGNVLNITGAGPLIQVRNPDGTLDTLAVYGVEGNDKISAQNLAAGLLKLTVEGGPGNDTITGSQGSDALAGGEGDDTVVWTLGLPADLLGGEAGMDMLQELGSSAADNVTVSAGALEAMIFNGVDRVNFFTDSSPTWSM